jgi:hypothetical protein
MPTLLDKITSFFSGGMLLSGVLPAVLAVTYSVLLLGRLTTLSLAGVWSGGDKTLATVLATLAVCLVAIILDALKPLFLRSLSGESPWVPQFFKKRQDAVRRDLEAKLQARTDDVVKWRAHVKIWQGQIKQALASAPPPPAVAAAPGVAEPLLKEIQKILLQAPDMATLPSHVSGLVSRAGLAAPKATEDQRTRLNRALAGVFSSVGRWLLADVAEKQRLRTTKFPPGEAVRGTQFGNAMAAVETYAHERYGTDLPLIWPRLRQLNRAADTWKAADDARAALDFLVAAFWIHVALAGVGIVLLPLLLHQSAWLLIAVVLWGAVVARLAYLAALESLDHYGRQLAAAFDLNRWALLDALHLPRPADAEEEYHTWHRFTDFLVVGPESSVRKEIRYR